MKKIILLIGLMCILTSCAEVIKTVPLPNGNQGYYLSCENGNSDWTNCYESATKVCNGKYTILDKTETSTSTQYGPLVKRGMFVECGKK